VAGWKKSMRKIFIAPGAVYLQMFSMVRLETATLSINFMWDVLHKWNRYHWYADKSLCVCLSKYIETRYYCES